MPFEISLDIYDPPYGWHAAWTVEVSEEGIIMQLGLKLEFTRRIKEEDRQTFRKACELAIGRYFDGRFVLQTKDGPQKPLGFTLNWDAPTPHRIIPVAEGFRYGALDHWYQDWTVIDLAHELGHAFGLVDEYRDPDSERRRHFEDEAVRQDHSLMGDYRQEGQVKAALRLRHGEQWAELISRITGTSYSATEAKTYQTCEGDTLGQIAARLLGDDRKRYELFEENSPPLTSMENLSAGILLTLPGD